MVPEMLRAELAAVPDLTLLERPEDLDRYSKDAYDYSPVLRERLASCRAALVVRPDTVEAVAAVAAACCRHGIALTLRGAGTGNYGQSVPLEGGVVMLMGRLRAVRRIEATTGIVTVECGCLLKDLDQ
ncbi:FAD-binding protein, partial [Pseudomonas sp. HMWF031]